MHPVVEKLLALQKIDSRVAQAQRKLDAVPNETAKRRSALTRLTAERDAVKNRIREIEVEIKDLEVRVGGIETAIKKQEEHRDNAQNASTFEAARHRIQLLSEDRDQLQSRELTLIEEQEALQPKLQELEEKVAAETEVFEAYLKEAERLEAELREERDRIAASREEYLDGIPPAQLSQYDEIFRSRGGIAVVALESDHCSGCYTRITPNDRAKLGSGSAIVNCKSCGRFLYAP